jgi:hypothetical protein
LVNVKSRTDQVVFDLLNHEDSAFEFSKIVAFVNDAKFSKKRLLSRSARYTGLLDKLDFVQAEQPDGLPTAEQLQGVRTWLAVLGVDQDGTNIPSNEVKLQQLRQIAELAQQAKDTLQNVAVLIMNANEMDASESQQALQALQDTGITYTVVAVGTIEDRPEGQTAYHFDEFGTEDAVLPAKAVFSREESFRMITELLQLECGVNKALTFAEVYNANVTEAKLIKGLREAGYARPQEIDHMIREGPEAYVKAIEEFKTQNPDAAKGYTTNPWWEAEEFQKSRRKTAEREEQKEQKVKDQRTLEIENVAKEWVKREYFRQSMSGTLENDMTEEEFTKTVWDRALLEGDMKYRQMKGETVDEEAELANFRAKQERKEQVMLKRAKAELAELLDGESIGGNDFKTDDDKEK